MPKYIIKEKKGVVQIPKLGIVNFSIAESNSRQSKYIVKGWIDPDWSRVKKNAPAKKGKPKRKLAGWEKVKSWRKLRLGASKRQIQRWLGRPKHARNDKYVLVWSYGGIADYGVVKFKSGLVKEWVEPFWPEVEKDLYEEQDISPEKKKQKIEQKSK